MTESEKLLEGLHQLMLEAKDDKEQSESASNYFSEFLQPYADDKALQIVCQSLVIEAATLIMVKRRIDAGLN